jgi:hypothetical protein
MESVRVSSGVLASMILRDRIRMAQKIISPLRERRNPRKLMNSNIVELCN